MKGTITYLGYRFELERTTRDGRDYIAFTPVDDDTPLDVVEALYKTVNQNVQCYLKRFSSPSDPSTL